MAPPKSARGPFADKLWRDALRRAVLKRVENDQRLDRIAEAVVAKAESGDIIAAREIGDRLDGKPAQALTIDATVHRDPNEISDADLAAIIGTPSSARAAAKKGHKAGLH